jgi:pimeloyl-ACP methyl ester carboxylesterase
LPTLSVGRHRLEYDWFHPAHPSPNQDAPVLVFLHEGLGSLAMWKNFPAHIAAATGCRVLVYSRLGYGKSDRLQEPRKVDYMHVEALDVLPEFLRLLDIENPVLVGHSDGASIALIFAGAAQWPVRALILLAPHVLVEELTVTSIAQAKVAYQTTDLPAKLGRYHDDVDNTFRGWNDIWLHPDFRYWNIEEFLPCVRCPVLVIQGKQDEYGTMEQVERIVRQVADVEVLKLDACQHSPHRDQPDAVSHAITRFVERISGRRDSA